MQIEDGMHGASPYPSSASKVPAASIGGWHSSGYERLAAIAAATMPNEVQLAATQPQPHRAAAGQDSFASQGNGPASLAPLGRATHRSHNSASAASAGPSDNAELQALRDKEKQLKAEVLHMCLCVCVRTLMRVCLQ
jgi:hypothetical protein